MQKIVAADLAAMSRVAPEIDRLGETDSEWWLGLFGVDKSSVYKEQASWTWPCWRDPFGNPVTAKTRLRVQTFARDSGEPGIGVVLAVPEEDFEQYVGWASEDRATEVGSWVEFLNGEIAALWSMWDAAGRPRGTSRPTTPPAPLASQMHGTSTWQPPAGTQTALPRDERTGRRLANGRFEVIEWLGTDALMGAAIARDHEQVNTVRLTLAADVAGSPDDIRAVLTRDVPGLAPVVYVGESASDDGWAPASMLMAERLPRGATELELPSGRGNARALAALGVRLVSQLLRVHHGGVVLGTLRPESTFLSADGHIELVCRGERLWLMPRPHMTRPSMLPPWRPGYQAPELITMLPLVRDPAPAADVFSVGVMMASALLGEFVYFTEYATDLVMMQRAGNHLPLPESPFGRLLTRCLLPDPAARPSLQEVEQTLRTADIIGHG